MKIRCELHLDHKLSRLILVPKPEEKLDHLALKLAAFAMFHEANPVVDPSVSHPSLAQADHKPDVMILNDAGEITCWIECGTVTMQKLGKIRRRFPSARFIILKSHLRDARRMKEEVLTEVRNPEKIEIWTWPDGSFDLWMNALEEKTELFGEAREKSLNLVVNNQAYSVDLISL